ncbi:MAG: ATP-binding cassette domain-containing protein [Streptococcaceae bacterium]|jgi:ABC-2 type transport system ATP-binding protein|nr:ATP-binding cassette domain-containing protein [Streptococcaceae bacterium]
MKLSNISKSFKNKTIIKDFSTILPSTGLIALIGANGIGKTTLLKMIAGYLAFDSGEVIYNQEKLNFLEDRYEKILFLGDEKVLVLNLSGKKHLELYQTSENQKMIEKLVRYYKMEGFLDKKVGDYSLGMKQMLLIVLMISSDVHVLLFDEILSISP